MKIAVFGTGYVGLSNAILLAQKHQVVAVDIIPNKVELINNGKSPFVDNDISYYLKNKKLNLKATLNVAEACKNADFAIIATPTDYDPVTNYFDTSSVEAVISEINELSSRICIVIKSTVPVGFTESISKKYKNPLLFSPEFLREGQALYDNLHPSRIVVGGDTEFARLFSNLLLDAALDDNVSVLLTHPTEAEAIKLFSNTYLAMRVSFFNELDSYCICKGLNTKSIIQGMGLDPRIGSHYNNPSFGYGGYCLPKDTKQLLANYKDVPQTLIKAIVDSNETRKTFIVSQIKETKAKKIGIYRLVMKSNSDNFRSSAIQDIMSKLNKEGRKILIYEPTLSRSSFNNFEVCADLEQFKKESDLIVANRYSPELEDVREKLYTRDIFNDN